MAYVREAVLARVLELAEAVEGIAAAKRNVLDLDELRRPGIAIKDGSEVLLRTNREGRGIVRPGVQMMIASPVITIHLRAGQENHGSLCNLYLGRFLKAVIEDAALAALIGNNGEIRYEGSSLEDPEAGGREARMELSLVFVYPFLASAL